MKTWITSVIAYSCMIVLPLSMRCQTTFAEGIISTSDADVYGLTFIDKDWICFTRSEGRGTLMFSRRAEGSWTLPVLAPFSGKYPDEYPRFDPESKRLFFASKRAVGTGEPKPFNDIWYVELQAGQWSEPRHLGGDFSQDGIDSGAVGARGLVYFHSDRGGSGLEDVDLYVMRFRASGETARKLPISTTRVDGEPYVFKGGEAMLFMSAGHDAVGHSDLFLSMRKNGQWQTPLPVDTTGKVNTPAWEYAPVLSPDLCSLYFTRYEHGRASIYAIAVSALSNGELRELVGD